MSWDFDHVTNIRKEGCCTTLFGFTRDGKYKKKLKKADTSVARELDLVKFIQRQRLTTFTTLAALNGRQQFIADKMATKLIRESSDLDDDTEDDFELAQENVMDVQNHSKKIFESNDIIDRRLIRAYQAKRWHDDYKLNKGKSSAFSEIKDH